MSPVAITLLVIVIVLAIIIAVLYFLGKKAQKKQAEQQELLDANKQTVSMLIIDKKRMKLKDAGLPQMVIDQTPKMMRGSKLPIIKAKVGPQIVSLICDDFRKCSREKGSKGRCQRYLCTGCQGTARQDRSCSGEKERLLQAHDRFRTGKGRSKACQVNSDSAIKK